MKKYSRSRPSQLRTVLIAVLLFTPSILPSAAAADDKAVASGGQGSAEKSPDITLYQLSPTPGNSTEINTALAVVDRELARMERVNNARRGPPRDEGKERIDELKTKRKTLGANFSKDGWNRMVRALFLAMETDRVAATKFDDASLWNLSRNPEFVDAGQATVNNLCAPCHLPTLRGAGAGTEAFGPDLTDTKWLHGGTPMEIYDFITHGAFTKGMPPWGSIIGPKKVAEVAAVVLSKHQPGEPIEVTTDPRPPVAPNTVTPSTRTGN
jgi:hypothetical protein